MTVEQKTITFNGLGTAPFQILVAGAKTVQGTLTLPNLNEGSTSSSQVVVTVNLNGGSAFYTGAAGALGFETGTFANPGDTINIILTSSLPADQGLNSVKSTLGVY